MTTMGLGDAVADVNSRIRRLFGRIENVKMDLPKNQLTVLEYKMILLKVEKQVYLAYNLKKNAEIFPKLMTKYTETSCKLLECIEQLVEFDNIPEGDYLEYAKNCPRQHDFIKKICEMGELQVKSGINYTPVFLP